MIAAAICSLVVGLVLAVFAMLFGTERRSGVASAGAPHERSGGHDRTTEPSALFNIASVAALCVAFGLTGYLLTRYTTWSLAALLIGATAAGALAFAAQALVIARWALPSARADQVDVRFLLQGTLATLTHDVPAGGVGSVRYAHDGRDFELPARAVNGAASTQGTEVVIDRIEEGVAYFELWEHVESRL